MAVKTKPMNLIRWTDYLDGYQEYALDAIEESRLDGPDGTRVMGFDQWYAEHGQHYQMAVKFELAHEGASGGYLTGTKYDRPEEVLIPPGIVSLTGGVFDECRLQEMGKRYAAAKSKRLPAVLFRGKRIYHWTW